MHTVTKTETIASTSIFTTTYSLTDDEYAAFCALDGTSECDEYLLTHQGGQEVGVTVETGHLGETIDLEFTMS